jgi:hypothetical protein
LPAELASTIKGLVNTIALAQGARLWSKLMNSPAVGKAGDIHQRGERLLLTSPVLVYGRAADETPFHDLAPILSLDPHGGVLALAAGVKSGETILLVNSETQEDRECRVTYVGPENNGRWKVAFEFLRR